MRTLHSATNPASLIQLFNPLQYWSSFLGNRRDQKAIRDHLWSRLSQDNHGPSIALQASPLGSRLYFRDVFFKQWVRKMKKVEKKLEDYKK